MKFLLKIFSPSLLIISLLLLFYTYYKSEIFWEDRSYLYLEYYIISSIILIISIISFFINKKIKEYLVIFLGSVFFSVYLFEFYLAYNQINKDNQRDLIIKDDFLEIENISLNRFEYFKKYKKKVNNSVVTVGPNYFLTKPESSILPFSGVSDSVTINCIEDGYYSIYKSDRFGFNNPDNEWNNKNIEYVLLGDSFTHGACVNRPSDIASVLRNISNTTSLNLGYNGMGPLLQLATLREYTKDINIKKVLWFYYEGNDLTINLSNELANKKLRKYFLEDNFTQKLKLNQNKINRITNQSIKVQEKQYSETSTSVILIKDILKLKNLRDPRKNITNKKIPFEEFENILKKTKLYLEKKNAELYFIYLPEYQRYKVKKYDNSNFNKVKKIINKLNIPFIDIKTDIFDEENFKYFPKLDQGEYLKHYNALGYRKIAEYIYKNINN